MTKAFSHMVTKQGFSLEWPCFVKRSKSFLLPHTPASESLAKSCLAETKFQFSSQNASSWTLSLHCSPPHQFWGWNSFIQRKDTGSHVFSGQASPLGSYRPGAAQALGTLLFPWVLFLCTQISAFLRTSPLQRTETDHLVGQVSWGCRNRS